MSNRRILGWYVMDAEGRQVAWHKLRTEARKIAARMSRADGTLYYTAPEVEGV